MSLSYMKNYSTMPAHQQLILRFYLKPDFSINLDTSSSRFLFYVTAAMNGPMTIPSVRPFVHPVLQCNPYLHKNNYKFHSSTILLFTFFFSFVVLSDGDIPNHIIITSQLNNPSLFLSHLSQHLFLSKPKVILITHSKGLNIFQLVSILLSVFCWDSYQSSYSSYCTHLELKVVIFFLHLSRIRNNFDIWNQSNHLFSFEHSTFYFISSGIVNHSNCYRWYINNDNINQVDQLSVLNKFIYTRQSRNELSNWICRTISVLKYSCHSACNDSIKYCNY